MKVTLQTRAQENFRSCRWGAELKVSAQTRKGADASITLGRSGVKIDSSTRTFLVTSCPCPSRRIIFFFCKLSCPFLDLIGQSKVQLVFHNYSYPFTITAILSQLQLSFHNYIYSFTITSILSHLQLSFHNYSYPFTITAILSQLQLAFHN